MNIRLRDLGSQASLSVWLELTNPENISTWSHFYYWTHFLITAGSGRDVEIGNGNNKNFNKNVHMNAGEDCGIVVGNAVLVAPNVVLHTSDHITTSVYKLIRKQNHRLGEIIIEDEVCLGSNVIVTGSVSIRKGAVITAGAVITHDVEPYSISSGVPARFIRKRG